MWTCLASQAGEPHDSRHQLMHWQEWPFGAYTRKGKHTPYLGKKQGHSLDAFGAGLVDPVRKTTKNSPKGKKSRSQTVYGESGKAKSTSRPASVEIRIKL